MKSLSLILFSMALAACGGGGSGEPIGVTTPVANELLGGIWEGTSTAAGNSQSIIGVTTDDGRFRFLSLSTEGQYIGSFSVFDQNQVSGSGFGVAPLGFVWSDGSTVTSLTVTGTVSERNSYGGSWATGSGESGTFNLDYDPIYNRTSSLAKVQGTYTSFDDFGNATGVFTIDSNGNVVGQDIDACVYGGLVSIVNSNYNLYEISLTVTNCVQFSGMYNGLGGLRDFNNTDDELLISVDNGSIFVIISVLR